MGSLTVNCWCSRISNSCTSISTLAHRYSTFMGGNLIHLYDMHKALPAETSRGLRYDTRSFAKKSVKKSTKNGDVEDKSPSEDYVQNDKMYPVLDSAAKNSIIIPSRSTVLQACTVTSGLIAALAVVIRQVSHVAAVEGLPILDCSAELSFGFEVWHLELIIGLVVLISSCRFLLLKTWTDFAKSSQAANQQILTSLEPLDYMVVAFLPGISEELLFRGALLPLFGFNWKSILVVAIIFGVLHLGSGRKYSFAVWATFVGLVYGYATIASSNLIVPMVSHAVNNLVGGILWRYSSRLSD